MAQITPRKRKNRSSSFDGLPCTSGSLKKKLAMDIDWTTSPLAPKNTESRRVGPKARKALGIFESDKENDSDSPVNKSLPLNRVKSPLLGSMNKWSPLKSPQPGSPFKPAVSTVSFYSKGKSYVTPLERKVQKDSIPQERYVHSPENQKTVDDCLMSPRSALRMASKQAKGPRNPKKTKLEEVPAQLQDQVRPTSKIKTGVPFKVLSFSAKPRPKLLLGAAYFSTGKKLHTAAKKQTLHSKPIQVASRTMAKGDLKKCGSVSEVPRASSGKAVVLERAAVDNGSDMPNEDGCEPALKQYETQGTRAKRTDSNCKVTGSQKSDHAQPSFCAPIDIQTSEPLKDKDRPCSDSEAECYSDYEMEEEEDCLFISRDSIKINHKVALPKESSYPIFSTPSTSKKRPPPLHENVASPLGSVPAASTPPTVPIPDHISKSSKRNKEAQREARDQMIIDAGQKHFGAVTCKSCGMIYTAASAEDETQHMQYHQRFLEGIKFVGWKKERTVVSFWDGKIILILPDDPKYASKKAEEVRELVDSELGFKQTTLSCPSMAKTYLFVSNEKKIIGCLIAEPIKQAYRVLTDQNYSKPQNEADHQRAWRCSTEPEAAICGISRIWVFRLLRRRSIASRMVDTLRGSFMYGSFLSVDEIAFSDPTPDGKLFASTYCKVPNFLVYNFLN